MRTVPLKSLTATMILPLAFAACDDPQAPDPGHPAFAQVSAGELAALAKEVRQATARFNSTTQASLAGYAEASPCVAAPGLGGMGFHWINLDLVDPEFDAMNPEALLYEPRRNGQLSLIGVEYVVIDVGQTAPTFDGQAFEVGGAPLPVPHWTLHVWLHKRNPAGLFSAFNPEVACP